VERCCGALMVGSIGALKHEGIVYDRLPLQYCPICRRHEVHPLVRDDFEQLVEFAKGDLASYIQFDDFVDYDEEALRQYQPLWDEGDPKKLIVQAIDQSLDLLTASKALHDQAWTLEIELRLRHLGQMLKSLSKQRSTKP